MTDQVDGKTRCLYVPVSMEAEVRRYAENWRELKSLMLEMSEWTRRMLVEEIAATTGRGVGARKGAGKGAAGAGRRAAGKSGRRRIQGAGRTGVPEGGRGRTPAGGTPPRSSSAGYTRSCPGSTGCSYSCLENPTDKIACTRRQATPTPHHRVLLADPLGGHKGPSKHCPHALQLQPAPHRSQWCTLSSLASWPASPVVTGPAHRGFPSAAAS